MVLNGYRLGYEKKVTMIHVNKGYRVHWEDSLQDVDTQSRSIRYELRVAPCLLSPLPVFSGIALN